MVNCSGANIASLEKGGSRIKLIGDVLMEPSDIRGSPLMGISSCAGLCDLVNHSFHEMVDGNTMGACMLKQEFRLL